MWRCELFRSTRCRRVESEIHTDQAVLSKPGRSTPYLSADNQKRTSSMHKSVFTIYGILSECFNMADACSGTLYRSPVTSSGTWHQLQQWIHNQHCRDSRSRAFWMMRGMMFLRRRYSKVLRSTACSTWLNLARSSPFKGLLFKA